MEMRISLIPLILTLVSAHDASDHDPWSLTGRTGPGPTKWAETYPLCNGSSQSPINVPADTKYDPNLTPFRFIGYDTLGPDDMEITNNGYTASVEIKNSSIGKAYFTGGGFSSKYLASKLHFHWGPDDNSGSDHSFQGKFFPAEVHFGHFKEEHGEIFYSTNFPDGLAGLAFYFELSAIDNPDLEPYLSALEYVTHEGDRQPVGLNLYKLMPEDTSDYYQYNGSMPLPPCKETVVWTLFKGARTISPAQLSRLRQLYDSASNATQPDPHQIDGNQRGVQPLGSRIVRRNFILSLSTKMECSKIVPIKDECFKRVTECYC